jgi:hypothetical protein
MLFQPVRLRYVAYALSVVNIAGTGYALGISEPLHAGVHAGLAALLGIWGWRGSRRAHATRAFDADDRDRLEMLEEALLEQRREFAEAQERLDFAERMLAQSAERRSSQLP